MFLCGHDCKATELLEAVRFFNENLPLGTRRPVLTWQASA